jgi:hypothetical protein
MLTSLIAPPPTAVKTPSNHEGSPAHGGAASKSGNYRIMAKLIRAGVLIRHPSEASTAAPAPTATVGGASSSAVAASPPADLNPEPAVPFCIVCLFAPSAAEGVLRSGRGSRFRFFGVSH